MPDILNEYFRGDYITERRERESLDRLIDKVLPTFRDCHQNGSWPYELTDGEAINIPTGSYSYSTNSMILYNLCASQGYLGFDSFGPGDSIVKIRRSKSLTNQQLRVIFSASLPTFRAHNHGMGADYSVFSSSYGVDDPFTLSWFLAVVFSLKRHDPDLLGTVFDDAGGEEFAQKLITSGMNTIGRLAQRLPLTFLDGCDNTPVDHVFCTLRTVHLAEILRKSMDTAHELTGNHVVTRNKLRKSLKKYAQEAANLRQFFLDRLYQHLAHDTVRDGPFDAAELVFSLEGALLCNPNRSFFDSDLLDRVFEVIDRRQQNNPYWRPLKPFLSTPQGFALLPLSVEIANSLLRICDLIHDEERSVSYFSQHLGLFNRYTEWLLTRSSEGEAGNGSQFFGWHSEHTFQPGKVNPWETSQVAIFLLHYRNRLQQHIAKRSSDAARFSITSRKKRPPTVGGERQSAAEYWQEKKEVLEPLKGANVKPKVFDDTYRQFIEPRVDPASTTKRRVSMLLYGPPGTGKSSLAEEIAKALEWPLITITPSDFVTSGEAEVEARAKLIFQALMEQANCVVLFDEIDRLILDRDSPWYSEQSDMFQFMTPGMLPKIKDLWKSGRLIFVVATNYEERIDPAAIRSGRVDERVLLSPPDLIARKAIIKNRISKALTEAGVEHPTVLSDAQLTALGKECPLASFGELDASIRDVVESYPPGEPPPVNLLNDHLSASFQKQDFALRLSAYTNRFNATKTSGEKQLSREPLDEFLLLVRLWLEAEQPFAPADKFLISKVLVSLAKKRSDNPDALVAGALANKKTALSTFLGDPGQCPDPYGSMKLIQAGIDAWFDEQALNAEVT